MVHSADQKHLGLIHIIKTDLFLLVMSLNLFPKPEYAYDDWCIAGAKELGEEVIMNVFKSSSIL